MKNFLRRLMLWLLVILCTPFAGAALVMLIIATIILTALFRLGELVDPPHRRWARP